MNIYERIIHLALCAAVASLIAGYMLLLPGCAHTESGKALEVFRAGHDRMQEMVDHTQAYCHQARAAMVSAGMDTADLERYCEKSWQVFKEYKKITDVILEQE